MKDGRLTHFSHKDEDRWTTMKKALLLASALLAAAIGVAHADNIAIAVWTDGTDLDTGTGLGALSGLRPAQSGWRHARRQRSRLRNYIRRTG